MGRLSRGTIKSGRARKARGGGTRRAHARRDATAYQHTRNRKIREGRSRWFAGAARRGVPTAHTRGREGTESVLCVVWNHQAIHTKSPPQQPPRPTRLDIVFQIMAAAAAAAADLTPARLPFRGPGRKLCVMTVFFGPLPPWLPLTLHSMEANDGVDFVVVGDAAPPAVLPPNVRFEHIAYAAMQARLSELTGRTVAYTNTYKANDIKPLLPRLYPDVVRSYEWWGWADLDVVFGDVLKFLARAEPHPACCAGLEVACNKRARRDRTSPCFNSTRPNQAADVFFDRHACTCRGHEAVTAVSPLYPNPWRKKCWGPFTLFKTSAGLHLFERASKWREALSTAEYTHFDEWWGPFVQRGYESMGDVMTRLSDEGRLVMSRQLLPFSEAKSCVDIECTFCPCGATRLRLDGRTLTVNGEETMILHLAESKHAWARLANATTATTTDGGGGEAAAWAMAPYTRRRSPTEPAACYEVDDLGALEADDALRHAGATATEALRYVRHRPASSKAAASVVYYKPRGSAAEQAAPMLAVRPCRADIAAGGGAGHPAPPLNDAVGALRGLTRRYNAYTAAERARTLAWLCAWQRLSDAYEGLLQGVDLQSAASRRLPLLHGNRRVRTPMYGGERLGWWRQTVNTSVAAADGACALRDAACPHHRWPELPGGGGGSGRGGRGGRARRHQHHHGGGGGGHGHGHRPGRMLRAKRGPSRYDLDAPPLPGVACMPEEGLAEDGAANGGADELTRRRIFGSYLQLNHARRAEYGRTQRWMCSWLYKLRACDDAERAQKGRAGPVDVLQSRCRQIEPPDDVKAGLGWRGHDVNRLVDLAPLLFAFRCW